MLSTGHKRQVVPNIRKTGQIQQMKRLRSQPKDIKQLENNNKGYPPNKVSILP